MSAATAPVFLADVLKHFQAFAQAAGVAPDQVNVRVTLADGSVLFLNGLQTAGSSAPGGFGMVQGLTGETSALVVREAHILKVQLDLSLPRRPAIGFVSTQT